MDNKTKQLIGFVASSLLVMIILVFFAGRGGVSTYPLSSDGQSIPITKEQTELSNISRSLAEIIPPHIDVPVGDVAVVPSSTGWKAIVFGVQDEAKRVKISQSLKDFSEKHPNVGVLEVAFDSPPNM